MIASVVTTLCGDAESLTKTLSVIGSSPHIEVGQHTPKCRRIPVTIDASHGEDIEAVTRWLQDLPGVELVDVVFVHFEDSATRR